MVNQELLNYVKDELARGTSVAKIKQNLLSKGWTSSDVDGALSAANTVPSGGKPSRQSGVSEPPKNIWLFVGIFALVIVVAVIIAVLFFAGGDDEVTCSGEGGYICYSDETCDGYWVNVDDTNDCCSSPCVPINTCTENWNCTAWSDCINNSRTRECNDTNNCGTTYYRPDLTESCGNQTNASCLGGDGCDLSCINQGGDSDCSCSGFDDYNNQNISLCEDNYVCNGTEINSSSSGLCCLGECFVVVCGEADGYCKLNCDGGDPDCTCAEQNGNLNPGVDSGDACGENLDPIFSSDNIVGQRYCCVVKEGTPITP